MLKIQRPVPVPTAQSLPFWESAKRGVLSLPKCDACGRIPYPPQEHCPVCLSRAMSWVELSGRASLRGWSEIHIAAIPGRKGPITVVEAALEEDPTAVIVALDEHGAVQSLAPDAPIVIRMMPDPNGFAFPTVVPAAEVS